MLEPFGGVEAVMTASVDALTAVEGIGPKTAESVRWVGVEKTVAYRPTLSR